MANPFTILVTNLQQLGFFGFLLPFILFLAIFYALLVKSKLTDNNKIIGIISLMLAFFIVGYGGPTFGNFLTNLFGNASIIIAGILVIILFIAMAGLDVSKIGGNNSVVVAIVGIGIVLFMTTVGSLGVKIGSDLIAIVFVIVVMGIAIFFIAGK